MKNYKVIVSNDCWGNAYYIRNKIPFLTPFIGTFVPPNSFFNLLNNFEIIKQPLVFIKNNPITAKLNADTNIVFLHYKSVKEAEDKWHRRLSRMLNYDIKDIVFKMSIMTVGVYKQYPTSNGLEVLCNFHNLPFDKKISFYDKSLGFVFDNPHSFAIDESFAKCALSLYNKTNEWSIIKEMF